MEKDLDSTNAGVCVCGDPVQEKKLTKRLAQSGVPHAQYEMSIRHSLQKRNEESSKKELYWLKKAAKNGHILAQYQMGYISEDLRTKKYWYKQAAKQGHEASQCELAYIYLQDFDISEELPRKGLSWLLKAAEKGLTFSMHNLGVAYYIGNGTDVNFEQSAFWFSKAAEQGFSLSQHNIAVMYLFGEGVDVDCDKAKRWLITASEDNSEYKDYADVIEHYSYVENQKERAVLCLMKLKSIEVACYYEW